MSPLNQPVDLHWNINEQVRGANYVHACLGEEHPHLNLAYLLDGKYHHVEIPYADADISHTKHGIFAQSS